LTSELLLQYKGAMDMADLPIVYFNPKTIEHKGLQEITKEQVFSAFDREDIIICNKSSEVIDYIRTIKWENTNLLMMSSGNFDGINFDELANKLI
ncbi:MAG: peptidoglycan synthetase, partial [Bacteroidales bacterium]|nr:peptidoglycan synthetase [Bacteroidales bacterium]